MDDKLFIGKNVLTVTVYLLWNKIAGKKNKKLEIM